MKRVAGLIVLLVLIPIFNLMARDNGDSQRNNSWSARDTNQNNSRNEVSDKQSTTTDQPVVIKMDQSSSGGHNRNFPSQQPNKLKIKTTPSYGALQWSAKAPPKQSTRTKPQQSNPRVNRLNNTGKINTFAVAEGYSSAAISPVSAVHHHPYEKNYVRKKLKTLGVVSSPGYITDREEIINTDRSHSSIVFPKLGFDARPLKATEFSSRKFNDKTIQAQMFLIGANAWQDRFRGFDKSESRINYYYWHKDKKFDYCHYIDIVGYHWYGWYTSGGYFWTRHFNNRWWWYDTGFNRWCFWNNGFWWWQDPYHIGDLYCYNNLNYIAVNSANDNVAVTAPNNSNANVFVSQDNTRKVKIVADTQDAFLYDMETPPTFDPVYLASGVKDVMFSDTGNGKELEIILKLNDGTFDMFDSFGNPYNSTAQEGK
ncbi:MAG: hypothetical protein WCJ46_04225 [bacterium]